VAIIAILFLSNKEVGKDVDHWVLTSSEGNGGFRCVAKLLCSHACRIARLVITLFFHQLAVVVASSTMVAARDSTTEVRAASQTCSC